MSGMKTALNQVKINFAFKKAIDLIITMIFVALIGRVFVFDTAAPLWRGVYRGLFFERAGKYLCRDGGGALRRFHHQFGIRHLLRIG